MSTFELTLKQKAQIKRCIEKEMARKKAEKQHEKEYGDVIRGLKNLHKNRRK